MDRGGEFLDLPACVTYQTFPSPYDSLGYYFLDPCECGPGVYPIIYSYTDTLSGLSDQDTMFITVDDSPTVEFDELIINSCDYTDPVLLTPIVDDGSTCEITGDWVLPDNLFDAAGAGIGTHEIEITCTSASGCSTTIIQKWGKKTFLWAKLI